jgi:hypothetical protein
MSRTRHLPLRRPSLLVLAGVVVAVSALPLLGGTASASPAGGAWIRVGHFSPSTGAVDVYLDGRVIDRKLGYEAVTPYHAVAAGRETVTFRRAGAAATSRPLVQTTTELAPGAAVTVAAVSGSHGPALRTITDDLVSPHRGDANVRIAGLDNSVSKLTATLTPVSGRHVGPLVFGPVQYGGASGYRSVPAGTYDLHVTNAAGHTVLTGTDWPVAAGTVASIVVASTADRPTVEVLRDATGASVMPTGGAQTGLGGTYPRLPGGSDTWPLAGAGVVLAGVAGLARRRRRPTPLAAPAGR